MSEAPIVRRSSYGPTSPEVGVRGATTRHRITEVSLHLFGCRGYFDTSVDAIANAAGVSRATLYQYFRGKDEIFLELLEECRAALYRVARRIGPLGPDEVGFDNLNWWLGEWSWVFEKYSTIFVQWSAVASMDSAAHAQIARSIRGYNHRIAGRLQASAARGPDPEAAAMVVTALVHEVNLLVHTDRVYGRSSKAVIDTLSVFLQSMLFPDTPGGVLQSLGLHASSDPVADVEAVTVPPAPDSCGLSLRARTSTLSRRAASTVVCLASAGVEQFKANGFRRTSVEDVIEAAGVARGTFYKYFSDKQDLFLAISAEIATEQARFAESVRGINPRIDEAALSHWLGSYCSFYDQNFGVIEAWSPGTAISGIVAGLAESSQAQVDTALAGMLADNPGRYPFDPIISALILRSLATSVPRWSADLLQPLSRNELIDLYMRCIHRGFFGAEA